MLGRDRARPGVEHGLLQPVPQLGEVAEERQRRERRVYEAYRAAPGAASVPTAVHLRNLGALLGELDRLDAAERAYGESQAVLLRALGPEHANVALSYPILATLLERRDRQPRKA